MVYMQICKLVLKFCQTCTRILMMLKFTVKILKIGTPKIITVIVLQMEQLDFTVQYCVQKMHTE